MIRKKAKKSKSSRKTKSTRAPEGAFGKLRFGRLKKIDLSEQMVFAPRKVHVTL